jgi:hypothetical protein
MPSEVRFTYRLAGTGWSEGRLVIGDRFADATASYLSDALGDLLRAALELARGAENARASWDEEPGEYRWIFNRTGERVRVRVLAFPEWRAIMDAPDEDGEMLLDASCAVGELIAAIAAGARKVLHEWGEDGYEAKWVDHPFPSRELEALEGLGRGAGSSVL